MKINNKVYDTLKYLAQVGLPALAVFVFTVGPIWELPKTDAISQTIVALNVLLGALLLLNQVKYNNSDDRFDGILDVRVTPPGMENQILGLDIADTVNHVTDKGEVKLKVLASPERDPIV